MRMRDRVFLLVFFLLLLMVPIFDWIVSDCISIPLGSGGDAACGNEAFQAILILSGFIIVLYLITWIKFDAGVIALKKRK